MTSFRRKLKSALCIAALLFPAGAVLRAQDAWIVMVEPSFMDHFVRRPIDGSARTVLSVARVVDGSPQMLTREEKRGMALPFDEIETVSASTSAAVLERLKPEIVRDAKGVIAYVLLSSEDPLTASTVLAPDFAARFRDLLGPDLLVAVPNRFQVFIFSRQDTVFQRMADAVVSAYHASDYPVSREIFALEGGRLRSLGVFQ